MIHRRPTRKTLTYRRTTAQEIRNTLHSYRHEVGDYGDDLGYAQGARLLKVGEQLAVLLNHEGYGDASTAVMTALRPLYEEIRAKREASR